MNFLQYYSLLNTSDVTDLSTLFTYANRTSENLFLPLTLLAIWFIWILGSTFIGKSISRAFLFASFICSIFSIIFVIFNWLNPNFMYFLFLMTALGLLWVRLAESFS